MKHIVLDEHAFDTQASTNPTLPILIGGPDKKIFLMNAKRVNNVLDEILDGADGAETTKTNYVEQLDELLA